MNPILQVFRKEIKEMVRDKRVRTAATVMPIFIVFLMMSLFGFMGKVLGGDAKRKVHVVSTSNPLLAQLKKAKNLDIKEVPSEAEGLALIQKGDARLLAVFEQQVKGVDHVRLRFDPKEDGAQLAKAAVMAALGPEIQKRVVKLLSTVSIRPDQLQTIAFDEKPVQVGEGKGSGGLIVTLLPYLLVLFTFTGGMALASDLVAGEKERSTLETLLIAPVRRTQIVMGKFYALGLVCLVGALSGMIGFWISSKLPMNAQIFKTGLGMTAVGAVEILLILLPLAATFSGVFIALSSFARNTREAQTYLGVLNLVVIIPAVFSQLIGMTDIGNAIWLPFVPILGAAAGVRLILLGKATALSIFGPFAVGVVLAGIALYAAVRLFHRESVLLRV